MRFLELSELILQKENVGAILKVGKVGFKEVSVMDLAKVMSKGQVTIPINIRKKLNLKEGDKVVFIEKDRYRVIANLASLAQLIPTFNCKRFQILVEYY